MAGGKETPRQKMIGMMYLVLTALLAMNVSASILEKFAFLNGGMEKSRDATLSRNEGKLTDIHLAVKERGNKPAEIKVAKEAEEIRKQTGSMLFYIEQLKTELINRSGGLSDGTMAKAQIPVTNVPGGMIPGAKNRDVVMEYMLGGNKNGEAYALKNKIEDYVAYLNQHAQVAHISFAVDAKDDPLAKDDPDQNGKDFAELNFEETPVVAAVAVLSQMQSKISNYEAEVLSEKKSLLGVTDWKFDQVALGVRTQSGIVAAGTKYKADMYLSATNTTLQPKMKWKLLGEDGMTAIDSTMMDLNGVGSFEFTARGGSYDKEGNSKKKWVGELIVQGPDGKMKTFLDTIEYVVSKPVMQIMNASVSSLYKNCGNKMNIQVPALGEAYKPVYNITGGTKIVGAKKGFVTIVPTAPTANLTVSSGGTVIGKQQFRVEKIPMPSIKMFANNGKAISFKKGLSSCPRSMTFRAIPDPTFKAQLPDDANYKVVEGEVLLARGRKPVGKAKIKNGKCNLSSLCGKMKDGDRLVVELTRVQRRNFQGKTERVKIPETIYNIPINF